MNISLNNIKLNAKVTAFKNTTVEEREKAIKDLAVEKKIMNQLFDLTEEQLAFLREAENLKAKKEELLITGDVIGAENVGKEISKKEAKARAKEAQKNLILGTDEAEAEVNEAAE